MKQSSTLLHSRIRSQDTQIQLYKESLHYLATLQFLLNIINIAIRCFSTSFIFTSKVDLFIGAGAGDNSLSS